MLDVGCSMLDVRCWMFDVGCSMLDVRCWMFDVRCSMLDVRCWMFDVGCSMLDVRCWMFDVACSVPLSGGVRGGLLRSNAPTPPRSPIQRTPHSQSRFLHHMRVNLR